jgi:hypothetical protein
MAVWEGKLEKIGVKLMKNGGGGKKKKKIKKWSRIFFFFDFFHKILIIPILPIKTLIFH